MTTRSGASRQGFLIPALLAFVIALTLIGHAGLVLSTQHLAVARLDARGVEAELSAESALRAISGKGWRPRKEIPMGSEGPSEQGWSGDETHVTLVPRRVGSELMVLRATSQWGSSPVRRRVSRVFWTLSPEAELGRFPAALLTDQLLVEDGELTVDLPAAPPSGWPGAACLDLESALDSIFGQGMPGMGSAMGLADSMAAAHGDPFLAPDVAGGFVAALGTRGYSAAADRRIAGLVTPQPRASGVRCEVERTENWGSPTDAQGPCGAWFPVVYAPGSVTVAGGTGQGSFLIEGSLSLQAGAHLLGVFVILGDLELTDGAELTGLARVGGTVRITGGGHVRGNPCAAGLALAGGGLMDLGVPVPDGSWMGGY